MGIYVEQETQMEITFNLFIHESNSITRSKKIPSLSNIKQNFIEYLKPASLTVMQEMHLIYKC